MQWIKVLHIDDKEDQYSALKDFSAEENIELIYCRTLAEGLEALKQDPAIYGVILDAKGLVSTNQTSEEFSFISEAILQLALLEKELDRHYPRIWYTGNKDHTSKHLYNHELVFDKNVIALYPEKANEMFKILRKKIENSDLYKLFSEYKDVLETFEGGYLDAPEEQKLLTELLLNTKSRKNHYFNDLRKVLETILSGLMIKYSSFPPELAHEHGNAKLSTFYWYLKGKEKNAPKGQKPRAAEHILKCYDLVEKTTNKFSHRKNVKDQEASPYTLRLTVFALCELLLWYKRVVDRNGELMDNA